MGYGIWDMGCARSTRRESVCSASGQFQRSIFRASWLQDQCTGPKRWRRSRIFCAAEHEHRHGMDTHARWIVMYRTGVGGFIGSIRLVRRCVLVHAGIIPAGDANNGTLPTQRWAGVRQMADRPDHRHREQNSALLLGLETRRPYCSP
jgi:hypothetical protein